MFLEDESGRRRARPVRGREDQRLAARLHVLARRVPRSKRGWHRLSLAAELASPKLSLTHAPRRPRRSRAAAVSGCERLGDRGGRPEHVDDDRRGARSASVGVKATCTRIGQCTWQGYDDLDGHAGETQTRTCYRHPRRETACQLLDCGRPICPDCMVYAARGDQMPRTCAGQPTGARAATRRPSGGRPGAGSRVRSSRRR